MPKDDAGKSALTSAYSDVLRDRQAKIAAEMQTEMQKLAGGLGLPPGVLPGM